MFTKLSSKWFFLILALLICLPALVQGQTAAQKRAQRQVDEKAVREMKDFGSDVAFVIFASAIRENAKVTGASLESVKRGDVLALVERQPTTKFYRVVNVESGVEGWIDANSVVIKLTTGDPNNAPEFEEEATEASQNPIVSISNLEKSTDLKLRINGILYTVKANSTKEITLKPGHYNYYGWSPGISPAIGNDDLEMGKKYRWTFKINRSSR